MKHVYTFLMVILISAMLLTGCTTIESPTPGPIPVPGPMTPEPVPEPSAGKKTRPGRRRIQWSATGVAKMINDDGYRLSDCARKIGVSTTCLILGFKRHNLKYLSKEIKVVELPK